MPGWEGLRGDRDLSYLEIAACVAVSLLEVMGRLARAARFCRSTVKVRVGLNVPGAGAFFERSGREFCEGLIMRRIQGVLDAEF